MGEGRGRNGREWEGEGVRRGADQGSKDTHIYLTNHDLTNHVVRELQCQLSA